MIDLTEINPLVLAVMVASLPTASMLGCSVFFFNNPVNAVIECCLQNFAAGLVIAATAMELFPLMNEIQGTEGLIGITIGFILGLTLVYGLESIMDYIMEDTSDTIKLQYSQDSNDGGGDLNNNINKDGNNISTYTNPLVVNADDSDNDSDTQSNASGSSADEAYHVQISKTRQKGDRWKADAVEHSSLLIR